MADSFEKAIALLLFGLVVFIIGMIPLMLYDAMSWEPIGFITGIFMAVALALIGCAAFIFGRMILHEDEV
jgi:hypothetical protein